MLPEFLTWWLAQLRSLLPASENSARRTPDALVVVIDPPMESDLPVETIPGTIMIRRDGRETPIQPLALDGRPPTALDRKLPVALRLPADSLLHREVVLPLQAERDLHAVIGFEMDRLTPFAASEVLWDISEVTRDRQHDRLSLRLAIVLRAQVQPLLDALGRIRLAPTFIEGDGGRIELAAATKMQWRRTQIALSALCACLAMACLAAPILRQEAALDQAARRIATLRPKAQEAFRLRQRLAAAASGRKAIASAQRSGDALEVLAALTQALPDGTWLSDLTLKTGTVTIDGHSTNAAGLIALLSATRRFRDPAFTAPVTRTVDGQADLFSLRMSVAQ